MVVNGTFVGFYDGWVAGRKFPVDMAGFAVSVQFLLQVIQVSLPLSVSLSLFLLSFNHTVLNLKIWGNIREMVSNY